MPIYLVRWPELTASLVRARDEGDLLDILDQVANPEGCEWSVYEGPLFIDFRLPAEGVIRGERPGEPVAPDQVVIKDVGTMAREPIVDVLDVSLAGGDDGHDTGEAILQKAFPVLHATVEKFRASDEAEERDFILPEAELREVLHAELVRMLKASWRQAQVERSTDPISKFAREMDMPVGLARRFAEAAQKEQGGEDDDPTTRGKGS